VRGRHGVLTRYSTSRPVDADEEWRDLAASGDRAPGYGGRVLARRITEATDA
jgi:hypothetical protein